MQSEINDPLGVERHCINSHVKQKNKGEVEMTYTVYEQAVTAKIVAEES
jgi:hypothetical protein